MTDPDFIECPDCQETSHLDDYDTGGACYENVFCPKCGVEFDPATGEIHEHTEAEVGYLMQLAAIKQHAPDVYEEIMRLAEIARECGTNDKWGQDPANEPACPLWDGPMDLCVGCAK